MENQRRQRLIASLVYERDLCNHALAIIGAIPITQEVALPEPADDVKQRERAMNTTELIERLQAIEAEHGVLPVGVETTTVALDLQDAEGYIDEHNARYDASRVEVDMAIPAAWHTGVVWICGFGDDSADEDE